MEFLIAKDLKELSYILAGRKAFFYRFCDNGFKTKWTGLWENGKKFLEYVAFKVNDVWLSSTNCTSFEMDEVVGTHNYSLRNLEVKESCFVSENEKCLILVLSFKNPAYHPQIIRLEAEIAVNIRNFDENWHEREYSTKEENGVIFVSSSLGTLCFTSIPEGFFEYNPLYKEHYPSGEKQRCFIPGRYFLNLSLPPTSKMDVFFIFCFGEDEMECRSFLNVAKASPFSLFLQKKVEMSRMDGCFFRSNQEWLDELFYWSSVSLKKLIHQTEEATGLLAGYPWYTQFWGRDMCWSVLGLLAIGDFETARSCLEVLMKFQSESGKIPNIIVGNKPLFNSADATPLLPIAVYKYHLYTNDISFLKSFEGQLRKIVEFYEAENTEFLMKNGKEETWMDTLERDGFCVEIQSFWREGLMCLDKLFEVIGESANLQKYAKKIEKKINKEFWNGWDFYYDRIAEWGKDETRRVNSIFPLFFGISKEDKLLNVLEGKEFTGKYGLRTLSANDLRFDPSSYHQGSSWAWINCLMACIEFRERRMEKAFQYLKVIHERIRKDCLGAIDEAWNSETGSTLLKKGFFMESSSPLQAWSCSLPLFCMDEFLLGIKPNSENNIIRISPSIPDGFEVKRKKRIGNDLVEIKLRRIGNELKVKVKSSSGEKYRIVKEPLV